jgi:hypothetical protein
LFHIFPEKDVVEGKDDWLYLIPYFDIPNYTNTNIPTQQHLAWLRDSYSRISSNFREKGIDYVVMIWPYKYSLYPEYFSNALMKVNDESAIDVLDYELSNNPNFDFRTAFNILDSGKQNRPVYYKAYDRSHWNQYGAFLGYTELMNQAKKHLSEFRILTEADFTITPMIRETRTSSGFYTQEEDLQYILKDGYHAFSDKSFFDTFEFTSNDPWKSYNYYVNSDRSLPKAVIVGDSNVWEFMLPNLAESFSKLVFIHYYDMDNLDTIVNIISPDIIIMAGQGLGVAYEFATYTNISSQYLYANIVSDTTPPQVELGSKYVIDITVRNNGTEIWNEVKKIRLCIFVDGQDYGYRVMIPEGMEVKPGETYTFKLVDFQAPPKESVYLEYQMVEEGREYFGEKKQVDITINNN